MLNPEFHYCGWCKKRFTREEKLIEHQQMSHTGLLPLPIPQDKPIIKGIKIPLNKTPIKETTNSTDSKNDAKDNVQPELFF